MRSSLPPTLAYLARIAMPATLMAGAIVLSTPHSGAALVPALAKCRDQIAKEQTRYVDTLFKSASACHADRSGGKESLATDCNDPSAGDLDGRNAAGRTRFRQRIGGEKSRCLGAEAVLDELRACPAPAATADDDGPTTGIDDFDEVASCLIALDDALVGLPMHASFGLPSSMPSSSAATCQAAITKAVRVLVKTYHKERRRCQRVIDKQTNSLEYVCHGTDPRRKIGAAIVRLNDALVRYCDIDDAEIQSLENCGDSLASLRDCVEEAIAPIGSALIAFAYSLDGTGGGGATTTTTTTTTLNNCGATFPVCGGNCPSGHACTNTGAVCECVEEAGACAPATLRNTFFARLGSPAAQTKLSVGWSGSTHNVDIPGRSVDIIDVSCDPNCENCDVSLNPIKTDPFSPCRCESNTSIRCDTINGPDGDDCPGLNQQCKCFFGAPLAISSGGTPVCVVNEIVEDYAGTMNLRSGEWHNSTRLSSLVHLGLSQTSPCPTCNGDPTPNDGVAGGTCNGGISSGACDVNGIHPTFGPTSYDCAPSPLTNISGNGLQLALEFSTGISTLTYDLPCDPPFGNCPCRVCSGDSTLGCTSNDDCAAQSAGACTAGGGAGVQPNACSDGVCSAQGLCSAGPTDTYCDGITHGDGQGFISCTTDLDCSALGAGTCTLSQQRRCFPDPIVVQGDPDRQNPVRATAFCVPPTTSFAVNSTGGLPGPGTFELESLADIRCQSDPSIPYDFPNGSSCLQTTTTTTTTLLPPVPCDSLLPPLCSAGTDCPPGEGCVTTATSCSCQPTTTTTTTTLLPPIACGSLLPPLCSVGSDCPAGQGCVGAGLACGCQPTTTTTLPPCGNATFPVCGGTCPSGQQCEAGLLACACQ